MIKSSSQQHYNKRIGDLGEQMALGYLKKNKYTILKKNFRTKGGEIDIIASCGKRLCFFEVKTRNSKVFGNPEYAVSFDKMRKMTRAAQTYLCYSKKEYDEIQFDVLSISLGENDPIYHIPNAFEAPF